MASLQERLEQRRQELRGQAQQPPPNTLLPGAGESQRQTGAPSAEGQAPVSLDQRLRERRQQLQAGTNVPATAGAVAAEDFASRNQFLAQQIGQPGLAESGSLELGVRADLGLSDTFEEKRSKFLTKFPDGDFIRVQEPPRQPGQFGTGRGGETILFRRNENEQFAELDAELVEKFEPLGDIADFAGELPSVALELVLTRGGSLVKQLLTLAFADLTAQGTKEAVEELRGFQKETVTELQQRALTRTLFTTAGGASSIVISGPLNALSGRGVVKVSPAGRAAIKAAKDLDIPPLLPGQVASSPMIRKLQGQAAATLSTVNEYIRRQQDRLVFGLTRLRDEDANKFLTGELQSLHRDARGQIIKGMAAAPKQLSEGGSALQQAIVEYDNISGAAVDDLYRAARRIEEPEFDFRSAQAVARQVLEGVSVRRAGDPTEAINIQPVRGEVQRLAAEIANIDPNLQTVKALIRGKEEDVTPVDQIRMLATRAWELSQTGPAASQAERAAARPAKELLAALNNVLDRPRATNPEFAEAWRLARTEAKKRFDTKEMAFVVQAAQSETPTKLARSLVQPFEVDNIRLAKSIILGEPERLKSLGVKVDPQRQANAAERWGEFVDAAKAEMLRDSDNLTTKMQSFDQPTLDALFTKAEQDQLRDIGRKIDRLNFIGVDNVIQRQEQAKTVVNDLLLAQGQPERAVSGFIDDVLERGPEAQRLVRGGILEAVFDRVVRVVDGEQVVDPAALRSTRQTLRDRGVDRLLTENDRQVLDNMEKVADFVPVRPDSGTSIQAAEAVSGIRGLEVNAMITILEHIGTGRLFTSPAAQKVLIGTGKGPQRPFASLRVLGAVLGRELNSLEKQQGNNQ